MYTGPSNPNMNYQKGAIRSLIQKALLDSSANVGGALVPQHLEKLITNTLLRLSPEIAMIVPKFDPQKYHEFNRLLTLPAAGGAMGEGGVTRTLRSTYQRTGRNLKVIRRKGAVTNFLQDASKNYIDAAAVEMENHLLSHVYDLVSYILYGNEQANQYSHMGLDPLIATNRTNKARGGEAPTTLKFLDDLIDANKRRQGANHRKCFIMSPEMCSAISRLLTNVRLNQGLIGTGLSTVEIPGGWRLSAYRDVPIIESTQCRPQITMGTVTTATSATGGTIPDGAYYFQVSAVTWDGESLASAEVTRTAAGGNLSTITLSWTPIAGALYYKIYVSGTTLTEVLTKVIAAKTYDSEGTPVADVASIRITTNPSTVDFTFDQLNGAAATSTTGTVPTACQADVPLLATGGVPPEYLFFWDLDEIQGMGKYAYTNSAGSRFNGLVTMEPLARTDDNLPFLVKTYGSLIDAFEATSAVIRGLRVA